MLPRWSASLVPLDSGRYDRTSDIRVIVSACRTGNISDEHPYIG
jgi:hypothetical protein